MRPIIPPKFNNALIVGNPRSGSSLVAWAARLDLGLVHRREQFFNEPFHAQNYDTEMRFNRIKILDAIDVGPTVVKDHWSHYLEYKHKTEQPLDITNLYKDFYRIRITRKNFKNIVWSNAVAEEYGMWEEESETLKTRKPVMITPDNFLNAFEKSIVDVNIERTFSRNTSLPFHKTYIYEDIESSINRHYPEIPLKKNKHYSSVVLNYGELNRLYSERIREWNLNKTNNWMIRDGRTIVDR